MFDVIFLQFLNGLDKGAAYALIALGLTLVFGTLGVVNFAHGALFMLGAFCAVMFRQFLTMETITIDPEKLSPWGSPLEIREPLVQAWFGDFGAVLAIIPYRRRSSSPFRSCLSSALRLNAASSSTSTIARMPNKSL